MDHSAANPAGYPDNDTAMQPDPQATTGAPRWVKVMWIVAIVAALGFVIPHLFTPGGLLMHGPRDFTLDENQEHVDDVDGHGSPDRDR